MHEPSHRELDLRNEDALLLPPSIAAKVLAISPRKLWGMTNRGEIPHLRLGRSVRYPVSELRRWIAERQKGGDAQ
ncbi:helix-turn-helix domain-containing protein [Symmachiella dynata]|uniref:helix-turn-helix domain-containing protein n=1 Tax=Symmachiella dynata TaxID=2527995 RepID=UPI003C6FC5AF